MTPGAVSRTSESRAHRTTVSATLAAKPTLGGVVSGLVASACCGGSLVFGSIGLGALHSTLGLWHYIPQLLTIGALAIVTINWLYYRQQARRTRGGSGCARAGLRVSALIGSAVGLAVMASTFLSLEWLNHALVNADRFVSRPDHAQSWIPGVPNAHLGYVLAGFGALALLAILPFPSEDHA